MSAPLKLPVFVKPVLALKSPWSQRPKVKIYGEFFFLNLGKEPKETGQIRL